MRTAYYITAKFYQVLLFSTSAVIVNKEEVEVKVEEEVKKGALLPYLGVKYNILYILYR